MYKKNIWNDNKTINIIAEGCFSDYYKIKLIACFFLIQTTEPTEIIDTDDVIYIHIILSKFFNNKKKG